MSVEGDQSNDHYNDEIINECLGRVIKGIEDYGSYEVQVSKEFQKIPNGLVS